MKTVEKFFRETGRKEHPAIPLELQVKNADWTKPCLFLYLQNKEYHAVGGGEWHDFVLRSVTGAFLDDTWYVVGEATSGEKESREVGTPDSTIE